MVGVILNLSIWFSLHVLMPGIEERYAGPVRYWLPPESGLDMVAAGLACIAVIALFPLRQGVLRTLVLCAVLALAWHFAGKLVT